LLPGVVSLFPKESGIIPLKASCHTPSSRKEEEYKGSSSSKNDGSRRLCLSDVPLGPAAIPSQEFPVLDLVSASGDYRDLVGTRGEEVGEWRGREEEREDSQRRNDIILIVFWQALAEFEARLKPQGRKVTVVTQNIDGLHHKAGSQDIIELHGSLFHTRCTSCSQVLENRDSPICPALKDRGAPDPDAEDARIPVSELPRCSECGGLLRPHVVWFGEALDSVVMDRAQSVLRSCDLCLLVGTSSVVYPAAGFAPMLATRGVPVAEFNLEETPVTGALTFQFKGKCGETLPPAIALHPSEQTA
ncbi:NAD-dependent protein deacylase sirtuin-5, mitochondrial, partial [Geodia barretti]